MPFTPEQLAGLHDPLAAARRRRWCRRVAVLVAAGVAGVAALVPWLDVVANEQRRASTLAIGAGLRAAAGGFCAMHGRWPSGADELFAHSFLDDACRDRWDRPFAFRPVGGDALTILSAGADGVFDTDDDVVSDR